MSKKEIVTFEKRSENKYVKLDVKYKDALKKIEELEKELSSLNAKLSKKTSSGNNSKGNSPS